MRLEPFKCGRRKFLCLSKAFCNGRFRNGVAGVLSEVALLPQFIEPHDNLRIYAECRWQGLYCRLMVPRLARQRAVAIGMQANIRKHPNRRVGTSKACLCADRSYLGVRDVAGGTIK